MRHAIWITLLWPCVALVQANYLEDNYPASILEDAQLTTLKLLAKYKYPAEEHFVTTEDKYILAMHRMWRPKARPVLLIHGILDSSATWIVMGPHSGLAYYLYDSGYDVWLGNVRGNRYSRNHTTLDPSRTAFWNFSWHEIGYYDLPAMIDAVLAKTGHKKLTYFGHSQGTTLFFVMASSRPEYNDKVHIMHALAPVAFMKRMPAPLAPLLRPGLLMLCKQTFMEIMRHSDIGLKNCGASKSSMDICLAFYFAIIGKNDKELNSTAFPLILGHSPAGSSIKQLCHFLQLRDSNVFGQYDYGPSENRRIYGSAKPPEYPIKLITTPIVLYYAANDFLTHVKDVERLANLLPNLVERNMHADKRANHMDICWGISARRLLQPRMLQLTRLYEI